MAFLLTIDTSITEVSALNDPGLTGVVVRMPATDLLTGKFNASFHQILERELELYCQVTLKSMGTISTQEMWVQLERLQAQFHRARIVLPFHKQSLELVKRSVKYGWNWHVEGVTDAVSVTKVLAAGAGGMWIRVGELDEQHEQMGDELCSKARSIVDELFSTERKPLVVATDVRDADHIERTVLYGCDRLVLTDGVWTAVCR